MAKKKPYVAITLTCLAIALLLWQQTKDETIRPEVQAELTQKPSTDIPANQNSFTAMLGFLAATPQDMMTEGEQIVTSANQYLKEKPATDNIPTKLPKQLSLIGNYELPCSIYTLNEQCLSEVYSEQHQIKQLIQENKPLINNYLTLQSLPKFANTLPAKVKSTPSYLYVSRISQLLTANAILNIKQNHTKEGITFILNDIRFYRSILKSKERTYQETLMAISLLGQQYFVLNRLISTGVNLTPYLPDIKKLASPFSTQEKSVVWALERLRLDNLLMFAEFGHLYFYTGNSPIGGCNKESCSIGRLFSTLFYKYHGTLNAAYEDWQPIITFAQKSPPLDNTLPSILTNVQQAEYARHQLSYARLYERYGLLIFKNTTGERSKNNAYSAEGYTSIFNQLYALNQMRQQLNEIITTYEQHPSP